MGSATGWREAITRSLRTTILGGILACVAVATVAFAAAVYVRAHRLAYASLRDNLTVRAESMAYELTLDHDGLEWDVPIRAMPEYMERGSGAYFLLYDPDGEIFARSPSLSDQLLPKPAAWREGGISYRELEDGPDGIPCAMVEIPFRVRLEDDGDEEDEQGWEAPPEEKLRFQLQLAADTRERDAGLRQIALFLAAAGAGVIGLSILCGLLVSRRVLRPIRRMTEEAARLSPEDTSRRLGPGHVVTELGSLSETLNLALDRLGDALERQRRFTSDASHELRTPVSVLLANSEFLLRRPRSVDDYVEGLTRQHRTAVRMQRITEDLLTLARADSHASSFERTPVDFGDLTATLCEEVRAVADANGIDLTCRAGRGVRVLGDSRYLSQLVANLVGNALKLTPPGGLVEVVLEQRGGHATLSVGDTGPGIPEEEQARVFDRFHRVGGDSGKEGSGLGLAIVAWVARAHGGTVRVESVPG